MKQNTPISQIMRSQPITVHPGDPISKARRLLVENGIHHLPVVQGDRLLGILSLTDILRVSFGDAFHTDVREVDATLDHTMKLEDLMEVQPVTLPLEATVRDAAGVLANGRFHAVPVVQGERLAGIVTSTDLIRYLLDQY